MSPKPITEQLVTEIDVGVSNDQLLLPTQSKYSPMANSPEPRKVKDGVDILNLQANKDPNQCESSLELILLTLSKAFSMSPK